MRRLREREETLANITGFGIKFQEAGGTQLLNMFDTNLGKGLHCARTPCPPCDTHSEGRDDCRARNVVYESVCLTCNPTSNKKDTQKDGGARGRNEGGRESMWEKPVAPSMRGQLNTIMMPRASPRSLTKSSTG